MITFDFLGSAAALFLSGLRYPLHAAAALLIHDTARLATAAYLPGEISSFVIAGAFGAATAGNGTGWERLAVDISGCLANYFCSGLSGGIQHEPTATLMRPYSGAACPFAVINLRMAMLSLAVTIWRLFG